MVAAGGVAEAFEAVRAQFPDVPVEVEVRHASTSCRGASRPAPTWCCSTTWTSTTMRAAVALVAGRARLEASGGLTLGQRAGRRRDRRRLPRRRRADPLGARSSTSRLDLAGGADLMLLTIDVGNTHTVLGLFEGDELVRALADHDRRARTADELALIFRGLLGSTEPDVTGIARLLDGAGRAARAARDARPLLRRRADRHRRARRPDRRAGAHRQPEGGRRRPHRQHAGRRPPVRRAVRSSSTSAPSTDLRRRVGARASTSAARSRPASRSRSTRWPRAAPSCARSSWSGRARSSARTPSRRCSRGICTASPARSTGWSTGSSPSSAAT